MPRAASFIRLPSNHMHLNHYLLGPKGTLRSILLDHNSHKEWPLARAMACLAFPDDSFALLPSAEVGGYGGVSLRNLSFDAA